MQTSPPTPLADKDSVAQGAFLVNQDWAPFSDATTGASGYQATLSWFEAGFLALTPSLVDYLGTGPVGGVPAGTNTATSARFVTSTRVIGRFYPDHFVTEVNQNFDCPAALKCPMAFDASKPAYPVSGGTYAGQPFSLTVSPYGLPRAGVAQRLDLFQAAASGTRALKLTAVTAPTAGASAAPGVFQPSAAFLSTDATSTVPKLSDDAATYTLPTPYKTGQLAAWSAPQLFYLRAAMTETVEGMASPTVTVSSAAPSTATAGTQYEDGMMAVIGRLMVQNAFGSELMRLPVPVSAQYWNGSAWVVNTSFGDNSVSQDIGDLKNCTRMLAQTGTTTCKPNIVAAAYAGSTIALSKGVGKVILQAPVRAAGSVDYIVPGALDWLPSTRARATFGIFKSPVIYLREVY
jgi:MSHA biogenesis protein MshQ